MAHLSEVIRSEEDCYSTDEDFQDAVDILEDDLKLPKQGENSQSSNNDSTSISEKFSSETKFGSDCMNQYNNNEQCRSSTETRKDDPNIFQSTCENGAGDNADDVSVSSVHSVVDEALNDNLHESNDDNSDNSGDESENSNLEKLKLLEETLSQEEKEERKEKAQSLKEKGNEIFKEGLFNKAKDEYTEALKLCPLCFQKERSIMYSNRAACKMRMELFDSSIKDCSLAIELNPLYTKCILRRAELYQKTEKLDEALVDYQKVIELEPTNTAARIACMQLPEQIKERNEKMKEEMMGKLKDLGNMILKPFGLSTEHFQMQQDPNSGGYSVQFNNNGK